MDSMVEPEYPSCKIGRNLTNQQREAILLMLLQESKDGNLKKGSLSTIASKFYVSPKTIGRIWRQAKYLLDRGLLVDVSSKLKGKAGRQKIQINPVAVSTILVRRRSNIRSMAKALNMSKSTLHRRVQEGVIRSHSNAIKPFLSSENKKQRLKFCLSQLDCRSCRSNVPFDGMYKYVHIDKKWFYMSQETEKYYLLPEETDPYSTCKSKHYITKVMFLAGVAWPRFDAAGNLIFSGKIGIFPFVTKEPAKRRSKNRSVGTLETKPILSVAKDVTRRCLIDKVLLAIRSKWPVCDAKDTIFIQQDNAKPYIDPNDMEFLEAAKKDGFNIQLVCQPPNSHDLNVLDLGFFRAIQSFPHQEAPSTIDELIDAVQKSYDNFSEHSLNNVFLTLQNCMIEVMKIGGGNHYKVPHMGKDRLQKEDNLPSTLRCDVEIVRSVLNQLSNL